MSGGKVLRFIYTRTRELRQCLYLQTLPVPSPDKGGGWRQVESRP